MGNKNKTISFRVEEDIFEELRRLADEEPEANGISQFFQDYAETITNLNSDEEIADVGDLNNVAVNSEGSADVLNSLISNYLQAMLEVYEQAHPDTPVSDFNKYRGSVLNHIELMQKDEDYKEFHVGLQERRYESFRDCVEHLEGEVQQIDSVEETNDFYEAFGKALDKAQWEEYEEARDAIEQYSQEDKITQEQSALLGSMVLGMEN